MLSFFHRWSNPLDPRKKWYITVIQLYTIKVKPVTVVFGDLSRTRNQVLVFEEAPVVH